MFKRALVSVSNKQGLVEFLRPLSANGLEIVSTGGTAQFLKENNFKVIDVSQVTDFPEVLDGRVKTLHPHIHMSLLAKQDSLDHQAALKEFSLQPFDLVICNLYPFEEAAKKGAQGAELIEKIDVGGPTMLRAAAKNFFSIAVVCDPNDYELVLNKTNTVELRKQLAAKVFAHTSYYDSLISKKLSDNDLATPYQTNAYLNFQSLRYGENSHQTANWKKDNLSELGLHQAQILQGKELSFNNLLDIESCLRLNCQFEKPSCVIVKHNNPCGVAYADKISDAVRKAYQADPVSAFGGIISVNKEVDRECAEILTSFFVECILAPSFSVEAREIFQKKKNLRLLQLESLNQVQVIQDYYKNKKEQRMVFGGLIEQNYDMVVCSSSQYEYVAGQKNDLNLEELSFAEKIVASLKSNAIAIVANGHTVGLGMGQVNRIDAVEHAIGRWKRFHASVKSPILASDAFFPFADSIELIAQSGIKTILQPGGSVKDEEVIAAASKYGLNMIFTRVRHFRH